MDGDCRVFDEPHVADGIRKCTTRDVRVEDGRPHALTLERPGESIAIERARACDLLVRLLLRAARALSRREKCSRPRKTKSQDGLPKTARMPGSENGKKSSTSLLETPGLDNFYVMSNLVIHIHDLGITAVLPRTHLDFPCPCAGPCEWHKHPFTDIRSDP